MNCRQHRSTMRRRVGAPSFAIRTASCMRQTIAERSAARAIRKSSSAPETFVKPACLFVLPRTWRYYQAIRHGAPFPYSMVPLAASAWPARPPERRRPTAVQLYRTTAARFRTAQRVLDQSSPHAVFRGAAAKSISFARCQRNQVHTPQERFGSKRADRCGTKSLGRCGCLLPGQLRGQRDRKSTRLNSSHGYISYAVFCLKKKKQNAINPLSADPAYSSHASLGPLSGGRAAVLTTGVSAIRALQRVDSFASHRLRVRRLRV